jgi:hypothetical protein
MRRAGTPASWNESVTEGYILSGAPPHQPVSWDQGLRRTEKLNVRINSWRNGDEPM